jgi:hypothetical protein
MHYSGYITGKILVNTEDETVITVISIWRRLED